jgi:hypothetical protein
MVLRSKALRVTLKIDGGFAYVPGLAQPIELSAAQLGGERAAQLQRLCEAACAVPPKRRASTAAPVPDGRRYRLIVEMERSRREVTAADPVDEPAIAELIAFIEEHRRP